MGNTGIDLLFNGYVTVSDAAIPRSLDLNSRPPDDWASALEEVHELLSNGHRVLLPVDRRTAFRRGAIRWSRWFLFPDASAQRLGARLECEVKTCLYLVWPALDQAGLIIPATGAKTGLRWAKKASVLGGGRGTRWSALLRRSPLYPAAIQMSAPLLIAFERRTVSIADPL